MVSFTTSSNTHFPVSRHVPHAMQPATGLVPIHTISVSMPSASSVSATSRSAV